MYHFYYVLLFLLKYMFNNLAISHENILENIFNHLRVTASKINLCPQKCILYANLKHIGMLNKPLSTSRVHQKP